MPTACCKLVKRLLTGVAESIMTLSLTPETDDLVHQFLVMRLLVLKGFTSGWRKVRKLSGFYDLHFHGLRHTSCSDLMLAGGNIKNVKDMIGHSETGWQLDTLILQMFKRLCRRNLQIITMEWISTKMSNSLTESVRHWEGTQGNTQGTQMDFSTPKWKISRKAWLLTNWFHI